MPRASWLNAEGESDWGSQNSPWSGPEAPAAEERRPRILVVDDEKRIADTVAEILDSAGFEARAVYDGWAALEAAAQFRPEYLLTDVLMPRMNGAELAIAIRQMSPGTKILLFSGQAGISEILENAQKRGYAFDVLAKPIHPARLIERLKEL